jgi:serine/threonine protein kinase
MTMPTSTVMGTSAYMAPEAFRGDVSVKLDTFSFGVVSWMLLTNSLRRGTVKTLHYISMDRLGGLVVRVLGYRSGGPVSIPGNTTKKK